MFRKSLTKSIRAVVCLALGGSVVMLTGQADLLGQTVQLPTFGVFQYSGAVSVPDGGAIQAGSIKRHAEGSIHNGVPLLGGIPGINRGFGNRAIGRETGSSGLTIKPTILIMSELEEDHLAAAGYGPDGRQQGSADSVLAKAAFLTENMGRNPSSDGHQSGSYGSRKR